MSRESKIIAQIMCDITRDVVWDHAKRVAENNGGFLVDQLVTRVGSGKKTYHTRKPVNNTYSHVITYGAKAVQDKTDFFRANGYFTGREIQERNYFNGEITYPNLIAHTIIHETAHAIQAVVGKRYANSVHNKHFYALLRELSNACDQEVLFELNTRTSKYGLSMDFDPNTYDVSEAGNPTLSRPKLQVGALISFKNRQGARSLGVIDRVGRSKSDVEVYQGEYKGNNVSVPNNWIRGLEPDDPRPDPKTVLRKKIDWKVGDPCHLEDGEGRYIGGYIVKANPKNCKVKVTEGRSDYIGYLLQVHRSMLREGHRLHKSLRNSSSSHEPSF